MKKLFNDIKEKHLTKEALLNYYKNNIEEKKHLYGVIAVLVIIILLFGIYFGVKSFLEYRAKKQAKEINLIITSNIKSKENCEIVLDFDKNSIPEKNKFFSEVIFDNFFENCDNKYNISNIELSEENCKSIIKEKKSFFQEKYIILDAYKSKINECSSKYLKAEFSTGSFFDVENDFKSSINIDFSLDFYTDEFEEGTEEFLSNRIEAKNRLLDLIEIEPKVDFSIDDLVLYSKKAILNLSLQPEKEYKISLKSFDTSIGEVTEKQEFVFTTPENKYFGMKIISKVSLFKNTNPPRFQILEYNSPKEKTKVKICRIPSETYTKIEIFRKDRKKEEINDFFKNKIDTFESIECKEKEIVFKDLEKKENLDQKGDIKLIKKDFNFDDLIGMPSKDGLYFVTFSGKEDREYNNKLSYPIFFGIISSHITMKISRNGEAFFFVNDFDGRPLASQDINLYLNNFKQKEHNWNSGTREDIITYFSPPETGVFDEAIILGKTGKDGILKVNLKDKVDDIFYRTFLNDWEYDYKGLFKTFFISSVSINNLSYLNSTWNSGIAPWNFGYKINDYYWYGNSDSSDQDLVKLNKWGPIEPEYYSHLYTDRVLYLPGEEVNIKGVIRKSSDLSIPSLKEANIIIKNSKNEEILNKFVKINEFGSITDTLSISSSAPLGNYNITVKIDEENIAYSGFSVEVFKNPKFKNDILLETEGLENGLIKIEKDKVNSEGRESALGQKKYYGWSRKEYTGNFKIKAKVFSKYYNGSSVSDANFKYKIYKQYYRDNTYWDNCYYGCYWEPQKEFYSEGKGKLDNNGVGEFEVNVDFSSYYNDYKYIVEVTVTDKAGDTISGANSVIAKLPNEYKKYNNELSVAFTPNTKFVRAGLETTINGGLNIGKWSEYYNDKHIFVIKKKNYTTKQVDDVNGYKRPITTSKEVLEKVLLVNDKNFTIQKDGKLSLNYKLEETGEYIFEYGKLNLKELIKYSGTGSIDTIQETIGSFNTLKKLSLDKTIKEDKEIETCENDNNGKKTNCKTEIKNVDTTKTLILDSLIDNNSKKYFSILTYGYEIASNPINNDNKIRVIPEKISYNIGETARVLIRLPVEKSKILWTIEKQGVVASEYIDVKGNIFFKEFIVDDKFVPNAYIGVVLVDTRKDVIPEYKVGYSEIVVDKTDKKSFISIKPDKKTYKPRENVTLNINVADKNNKGKKSELTVMVVDDSLISLMGNVDLNTLEKFYKKLPFGIQTSITNIAMLKNYYFSVPGIVGGSGFGNFKGGDSAVSTRNIFKNTAYYNPSVITDWNGNAQVSFNLPDNLTNFRVMVVSNSKDNFFGYSEEFIFIRKPVIIEDKTPIILREGDKSTIGANLFNNSAKDIGFKVELTIPDIEIENPIKEITIKAGDFEFLSWNIYNDYNQEKIEYTISALGDSRENSDKIKNIIKVKESPILINNIIKSGIVEEGTALDIDIDIPKNINLEKSKVEVVFSNNRLNGIEKIVSSLAKYPYGCIEQTVSTTLPNAILKKFNKVFGINGVNEKDIDNNLNVGIERIKSMQTSDGGFAYWQGSNSSNLQITPYVVRSLIDMKNVGIEIPNDLLENGVNYLEKNISLAENDLEKAEIFWALAKAGKKVDIKLDSITLNRHTLLAYTYGLIINKTENSFLIEQNVEKIKDLLKTGKPSSRYRNNLSDKAIFTSLLIDYGYREDYIDELIVELYNLDWSSYYYSTQSKNNTFIAFSKYLEKYGSDNKTKFGYMLGRERNHEKLFWVGHNAPNMRKYEFSLLDVLNDDKLKFRVANIEGSNMYVDIILKHYPEDKTKIKSYSNGMNIERKIYEVTDENKLSECSNTYYYNKNKTNCDNVLINTNGNIFKKGKLYKAELIVKLDETQNTRNLVIEDYLPGSFRVINSKYKTESISVAGTSKNWNWNHKEHNPDVVMASASYVWGNKAVYEYYFRAEFTGTYTHPPATAYLMYNPIIRANNEFNIITVK